ncbi:50S ribosomal protein L3 [bacterium]|nr:50S ribosomal protein L3 [bacterium]|tara:strand:+ start:372 stop:995 length:624 start_codon:yes stop_codon:yes gene_type:complete
MKFILGTKDGMTQVYDESGVAHPATVLRVGENVVTQVKTPDSDGYAAVQVATGAKNAERTNKAAKGHFGETGFQHVREFRTRFNFDDSVESFEKGATLAADVFAVGDTVAVSAVSKGKGFQGVVKRYNFKGGPASHGQKHSHREPGSIGATGPARVFKGTRMAGRMGSDRTTVKNLEVLQVNPEENLLLIKGAIPGRKGTLVEVRGL